jgi:class 3 adenylate cyclase
VKIVRRNAVYGSVLLLLSFVLINFAGFTLFFFRYETVLSLTELTLIDYYDLSEFLLLAMGGGFLLTSFSFFLAFQIFLIFANPADKSGTDCVNRASRLPVLSVIFSLVCWGTSFSGLGFLLYYFNASALLIGKVITFASVIAMVTVVTLYYMVNFINTLYLLPFVSKNIPLLPDSAKKIRFPLSVRFMLFFISISLVPLLFLLFMYASLTIQFGRYDLFLNIIGVGVVLLLVPLVLSFAFSRSIALPLRRLREAAEKIGNGEYDSPVYVYSGDELGQLARTINLTAIELREGKRMKESFGIMVDPVIRDHILKGKLELGGELRFATILFTDIRNFTGMSENFPPDIIVEVINSYFDRMSECVSLEHGIVNKFIGDALLAVFGEPVIMEDPVDAALRAAIVMRKDLKVLNESLTERRLPVIDAGLGVHTGDVLAGNIGSKRRMEYTVIGDAVNVATKIEKLTKIYQIPIVISESSYYFIMHKELFSIREIDNVRVKGKLEPVRLFEVFDCDDDKTKEKKRKTSKAFAKAIDAYRKGDFKTAFQGFSEICRYNEFDSVASMYVSRCRKLLAGGTRSSWSGVTIVK